MRTILDCRDVTFAYSREPVLRDVSLAELFDQLSPKPTPLAALPVLATSGCCHAGSHAVETTPA